MIGQVAGKTQPRTVLLDMVRSGQNLGYMLEAVPIELFFWGLRETQISAPEGFILRNCSSGAC